MLYTLVVTLNVGRVWRRGEMAEQRWPGPEVLLAAAGVLVGIAVVGFAELGARAFVDPGRTTTADAIYAGHKYSERLGWEPRPQATFVVNGARTTINAFGYRGRPVPRITQPAARRVVLLGDSIVFGYGVADGQSFADLLDASQARYETVNLAVPGYGVDQSLLRYELTGRSWHPHVVVLNLCVANDLADIILPVFLYDGQHPKPRFELLNNALTLQDAHLKLSPRARVGHWLSEHSHLYRSLHKQRAPAQPLSEHWSRRQRRAVADRRAALDLMVALIARLRHDVERDGATLVLAVHPSQESYRRKRDWVARIATRQELRGLQVVALARAYRREGAAFAEIALDGIGHLNPHGHALAARELRRVLDAPGA